MTNVKLTMKDSNGKEIIREIDITNIMVNDTDCLKIASARKQESLLNEWIKERGNEQHQTILTLIDWEVV